ncbi:hypothetical protein I79_017389 [Cricetulus griseus]|uniref:Uncharacterized protein n=1 Tax=Cricetulus griseus TaxID=10029 RepID=G3I1W8_CRIGR|nr:hypothetical protein I79_017389 [Cricetulus griseus]
MATPALVSFLFLSSSPLFFSLLLGLLVSIPALRLSLEPRDTTSPTGGIEGRAGQMRYPEKTLGKSCSCTVGQPRSSDTCSLQFEGATGVLAWACFPGVYRVGCV